MKKVAYRVDFVTVHHCTKFRSHICNIGNVTKGGTLCPPPRYYKGPKSPVLIGLNDRKKSGRETIVITIAIVLRTIPERQIFTFPIVLVIVLQPQFLWFKIQCPFNFYEFYVN